MCAPVDVSFIGSLVNPPARMHTRWPQHLHIACQPHTHTPSLDSALFRCEPSWPSAVWQSSTHRTDLFPHFPLSSRRGWRATLSTRTVSRAPPLHHATCCSNTMTWHVAACNVRLYVRVDHECSHVTLLARNHSNPALAFSNTDLFVGCCAHGHVVSIECYFGPV
jgi:hypothetical protein